MAVATAPAHTAPWPENLINAVLQGQYHGQEPEIKQAGLEHIMLYLAYQKNPDHAKQLEAVYRKGVTPKTIGQQNGLTETAIKMHIIQILRYLQGPQFKTLYQNGIMAWCQEQNETTRLMAVKQSYSEGYQAGLNNQPPASFDTTPLNQIPIEILNLSARAYNALHRFSKVKTVDDLIQLTEEDLMCIRNMGVASVQDIIHRLDEHGLSLRKS